MIVFLTLVGLVVVLGIAGAVRETLLDRPAEIPRSRFVDPDLLPPAGRRPLV